MARNDMYHKVEIDDILDEIRLAPRMSFGSKELQMTITGVCLCPAPKPVKLETLEQTLKVKGLQLPLDYQTFLRFANGGSAETLSI